MLTPDGFRYTCIGFDKQCHFARLANDGPWSLNIASGLITFNGSSRWQIQLIGTESTEDISWLWAWANKASNIPSHLLAASLALKAFGEQHSIPELIHPQVPLDQIDGHMLALLASGICEANAYYRCPYDGGALYVLIMDDDFPECPDPPLQRVATVFPQAIATLDIPDHEAALCGYLDDFDLEHEHTDNQIVVRDEDGEPVLTATFDAQKRLTGLEVELEAQADGQDEGTPTENSPAENESEVNTPPGKSSFENSPEQNGPATGTSVESWDEAQLRRMLGG